MLRLTYDSNDGEDFCACFYVLTCFAILLWCTCACLCISVSTCLCIAIERGIYHTITPSHTNTLVFNDFTPLVYV